MLSMKIKNTFSMNGCNPIAELVFRLLESCLLKVIPSRASFPGYQSVGVWDIVNAGENHRYSVGIVSTKKSCIVSNCTLGLQYGMGAAKLSVKLSADMGRQITVEEATRLLELHKKVYPIYWRWLDSIETEYKSRRRLILRDGWALLGDNDNILSVKNFPVQGTGAAIMRDAVRRCHEAGLMVLSPLHDALYIYARVEDALAASDTLARCMDEAVEWALGDVLKIRQDKDVHDHSHIWIDEKGERHFKLLSKYLEHLETDSDVIQGLYSTVMRDPI